MVTPSTTSVKAPRPKKRRLSRRSTALYFIAVAVVAVLATCVAWWLFVSPRLPSSDRSGADEGVAAIIPSSAVTVAALRTRGGLGGSGKKKKGKRKGSAVAVVGEESTSDSAPALSAKIALSTNRPYLIYGTAWKEDRTASLVSSAIHAGFRHVDTACQPKHYREGGVGQGWTSAASDLGLAREDFFLQTKFTSLQGQDPEDVPYDVGAALEDRVRQSLDASLRNLKTDYVDSLLLHSPMPTMDETLAVWRVFESFVDDGTVRRIGISNIYDLTKLKKLFEEARIKPWAVQNRFHKKTNFDDRIRNFCKEQSVTYQSFWTLTANRKALGSSEWKRRAKSKGLSPQTLMYAYMMALGHTPLSGTTDGGHMEEDAAVMARMRGGETLLIPGEVEELGSLLGVPA